MCKGVVCDFRFNSSYHAWTPDKAGSCTAYFPWLHPSSKILLTLASLSSSVPLVPQTFCMWFIAPTLLANLPLHIGQYSFTTSFRYWSLYPCVLTLCVCSLCGVENDDVQPGESQWYFNSFCGPIFGCALSSLDTWVVAVCVCFLVRVAIGPLTERSTLILPLVEISQCIVKSNGWCRRPFSFVFWASLRENSVMRCRAMSKKARSGIAVELMLERRKRAPQEVM